MKSELIEALIEALIERLKGYDQKALNRSEGDHIMYSFINWRRWTWDEIYVALGRESTWGQVFEVDHALIDDPIECGAARALGQEPWHYRFVSSSGSSLYVLDRGDRYVAFLSPDGPVAQQLPIQHDGGTLEADGLSRAAAAAGMFMFLGSLSVLVGSVLSHWV